jgi:hypothetical protein
MKEQIMTDKTSIADLANEMVEAAVSGQTAGLRVLLAEMQALTQVMPGAGHETAAERLAHEAEVEADFDNMPV